MLYIVGTPIGNLGDITYRAVEVLNNCDYILCEDTRISRVLLDHYGIKKRCVAYHKFNEESVKDSVISDLKDGKDIALISDAGLPLISDPGSVLVKNIIDNDIKYTVVGGGCAFVSAAILGNISTPFTFIGFLKDGKSRREQLLRARDIHTNLIFYVASHDLAADIKDIYDVLGDRNATIVREISKMHESVYRFKLSSGYTGDSRGEFVLIVDNMGVVENSLNTLSITEHLMHYINLGFSKNDAVKMVATDRNVKKNEIYKYAIDLK